MYYYHYYVTLPSYTSGDIRLGTWRKVQQLSVTTRSQTCTPHCSLREKLEGGNLLPTDHWNEHRPSSGDYHIHLWSPARHPGLVAQSIYIPSSYAITLQPHKQQYMPSCIVSWYALFKDVFKSLVLIICSVFCSFVGIPFFSAALCETSVRMMNAVQDGYNTI